MPHDDAARSLSRTLIRLYGPDALVEAHRTAVHSEQADDPDIAGLWRDVIELLTRHAEQDR